ncbi:hypothetical protein MHU86_6370 [Fragilaria crotonensis]|nr:hypothetical protein MHU86_6370 [Fragilaria crotonensis]
MFLHLRLETNLLTRFLDDKTFHVDLPDHVFYLQDDVDTAHPSNEASAHTVSLDAEFGDMLQAKKLDADDIEFETFDQYIGAEFLVNQNGEEPVPAKVTN